MSHIAKQAVDEYFDVLLTEPQPEPPLKTVDSMAKVEAKPTLQQKSKTKTAHQEKVAQLLAKAQQQALEDAPPVKAVAQPVISTEQVKVEPKPAVVNEITTPPVIKEQTAKAQHQADTVSWLDELSDEFPCLYFKVAGLVLAVPLQMLGGIKQFGEQSKLPGQPSWLMGQQIEREQAIYTVDSCRWLMPDRYLQLADSIQYQYLVQLGASRWAFACESLIDAEPLTKSEVKWRRSGDKRRYLAGIVKEKMCVILDVPELIGLLDAGLDSKR